MVGAPGEVGLAGLTGTAVDTGIGGIILVIIVTDTLSIIDSEDGTGTMQVGGTAIGMRVYTETGR